jgi:ketosteroid isomerase-like protein
MSANLDLVRSIYADWERGDFSQTEWAHRDVELVWADGPSPTTWSGLRGAEAGWREFLGTWKDYRVHPEDYLAPDDERVLVLVRFTARGKVSGLEVGESHPKGANLFHIRDGLVRRLVLYWDRDRALADLGLEGG